MDTLANEKDTPPVSFIDQSRRRFLRLFGLVGMTIVPLWTLGIILFKLGDPVFPVQIILTGLSFVLFAFSFAKKPTPGYWVGTLLTFIVTLLFNIGPGGHGLERDFSSLFLFPMAALLLLGARFGTIGTIVYILIIVFVLISNVTQMNAKPSLILQLIMNTVSGIGILYFYQWAQDKTQQEVLTEQKKREETINQLHTEVQKRQEAEILLNDQLRKIEIQKKELEDLNHLMIGRENAMADMKRKMEELEHKLTMMHD
jgi:hypothetical protein